MKGAQKRKSGLNGIALIEEATQLLRAAPARTLAAYYLGAIPFVLGFLFFWADMSRSAFADQHLAEAALGVTVLFLWMKFFQAQFARCLRVQLAAATVSPQTLRRHLRLLLTQSIVQPTALFVLPIAAIPVLPLGWVYAFYQNATALADPDSTEISTLLKRSWKQASLWPMQNHLALSFAVGFAFFVFLNWITIGFTLPSLLKMFFGIETIFSQSPISMLNSTFFMASAGLTYLCVDPILKTAYVLRCFYGESLQSGEDLKAELKRFAAASQPITVALIGLLLFGGSGVVLGQNESSTQPASVPAAPILSPSKLDRQIDEVIHERKYAWRMPRERTDETKVKKGALTRFFEKIGAALRDATKKFLHWLGDLFDRWFKSKQKNSSHAGDGLGFSRLLSSQGLLFLLVAIALSALAIFLIRLWRQRKPAAKAIATESIQSTPDLADENVAADQLPEDGWTKLARELLERGEFRLAMRAFYFASLAHLAERNLIGIARFKSNREYENELRRRAHAIPSLLPVFDENLSAFEKIWYGMHEVNRELVQQFAANVDKIRNAG